MRLTKDTYIRGIAFRMQDYPNSKVAERCNEILLDRWEEIKNRFKLEDLKRVYEYTLEHTTDLDFKFVTFILTDVEVLMSR